MLCRTCVSVRLSSFVAWRTHARFCCSTPLLVLWRQKKIYLRRALETAQVQVDTVNCSYARTDLYPKWFQASGTHGHETIREEHPRGQVLKNCCSSGPFVLLSQRYWGRFWRVISRQLAARRSGGSAASTIRGRTVTHPDSCSAKRFAAKKRKKCCALKTFSFALFVRHKHVPLGRGNRGGERGNSPVGEDLQYLPKALGRKKRKILSPTEKSPLQQPTRQTRLFFFYGTTQKMHTVRAITRHPSYMAVSPVQKVPRARA